jgi:hypothetical protein
MTADPLAALRCATADLTARSVGYAVVGGFGVKRVVLRSLEDWTTGLPSRWSGPLVPVLRMGLPVAVPIGYLSASCRRSCFGRPMPPPR